MKAYTHNPNIFHNHFVGQGMPAFRGARVQRGNGVIFNKLKRFAVPLLQAGVSAAAPHISNVVKNLARGAFPNNPLMQRVVGNVAGQVTGQVMKRVGGPAIKKRKATKGPRRATKRRVTTSKNIFSG